MSVTAPFGNTNSFVGGDDLPAAEVNAHADDLATTRASRSSVSLASGNVTLSTAQSETVVIECTGTLTANRQLIVPLTSGQWWWVRNATSGSYTVTVIGATGTGIVAPQGAACLVYTDGTNVLLATIPVEQDGDLTAGAVPIGALEDDVQDAVPTLSISVGAEAGDVIQVSAQWKDLAGNNLVRRLAGLVYLSDSANAAPSATAPSGGWAAGTGYKIVDHTANLVGEFATDGNGLMRVDVTHSGVRTWYLHVVANDRVWASGAVAFA